ncbi:MAG: hypothetical protein HY040_03715 [Planctomycetes bacterium]|nr:hypothetical protein [Planctomycetota bacterium]
MLSERAGIARVQAPTEITVRWERSALKDASDIRLFHVVNNQKTAVPCQILAVTSHDATDTFAPAAQSFIRLAFLADVDAKGTATYEVALGGPRPPVGAALKVAGTGVGTTAETGPVAFELHGPSGQLLALTAPHPVGSDKKAQRDRLVFLQSKERGEVPIHWNPDAWPIGKPWGHTSDWNMPVAFDPSVHAVDVPPAATDKKLPFFYREWRGPLLYRLTRWGRMPFAPEADVSVTYTFHAGSPIVLVESVMQFRKALAVHAVRNDELVFSRHQFDTALWVTKDGKLHKAPAYDHSDKDRSFKEIARLPPDIPCLGLANERKGHGVAHITLSTTNVNRLTGNAADESAHFYIRDYDEHGRGSPANFLYFVRPLVYRAGYLPTKVESGSIYVARSGILLFNLGKGENRYEELLRWQRALAEPLQVVVD